MVQDNNFDIIIQHIVSSGHFICRCTVPKILILSAVFPSTHIGYSFSLLKQMVLNIWGNELNSRTETEKQSYKGKLQAATHSQTVTYIKPLFRKLKNKVCSLLS